MAIPDGIQRDAIPAERDRIVAAAQAILNRSNGALSDDDQAAYDEHLADLETLRQRDQQLANVERFAALGGERANPSAVPEQLRRDTGPVGRTQTHTDAARLLARSNGMLGDELPDVLARQVEGDATPYSAERVLATADPDYATAWAKVAADPVSGHRRFTTQEATAWERGTAWSERLDLASGAAAVPVHLDPTVLLSSDGVTDPMRKIARTVTLTTGTTWHGVSSDGVTSRWAGEGTEAGDDSPGMNAPEVETWKADSFVPISLEALSDMANVDSELRRLFVDAKVTHEGPAFVTGTGVGQPQGLVTGLTATETVNTAAVGALADEDVYGLIEALPPRFRANAAWLAALGVLNALTTMETGNGAKVFPELANDRLLRKPIHEHSEVSDTIATGEHILIVGDFRNYVVVDRAGFAVELVPHLFGANRRPTGERGYYAWWRVGGAPVVANGFRRLAVA